jgi:hypothetical protein
MHTVSATPTLTSCLYAHNLDVGLILILCVLQVGAGLAAIYLDPETRCVFCFSSIDLLIRAHASFADPIAGIRVLYGLATLAVIYRLYAAPA